VADKEIKQRIVLEGEKQYNAAIKEAQRNLRTLKSELKAETAELGKNASEQQKAEAKAKSLKQQIAEQEKIVKTLKQALAEVKKDYGDNAEEVAKWEIKLNNARTTLANMQNELEGVGSGFQNVNANAAQATVATKSVADALGSIGSAGASVSTAIENIFTGLIDQMTGAVEQLWELLSETAARANNWTDLASYYGSSASEIQMWSKSIEAAGGDFEKFTAVVNRLSFGGKEKKITELLGISKENYQNDVQYTLAVLDELNKRSAELGQQWTDSTMSEIFGAKKAADVAWFLANAEGHTGANGEWIEGWRSNPERFNGEGSYGLTSDEIGTMNDLYLVVSNIETKWQDLKDQFAAGLGGVALDLLVNVEGAMDGVAEFLNAKDESEREAALEKIRTNLESFFRRLGEAVTEAIGVLNEVGQELQESDDPVTKAIGDILVGLTEALDWMIKHQDEVKIAFEAIFGVWLLGKLAAVAGSLGSIIMQIEAIKAFKGISVTTSAVEAVGGTAGAIWAKSFAATALKAVPWLAGLITLVTPAEGGNNDLTDANGNLNNEFWENALGGYNDNFNELMAAAEKRYGLNFARDSGEAGRKTWDLTPDRLAQVSAAISAGKTDVQGFLDFLELNYEWNWGAVDEEVPTVPEGKRGGPKRNPDAQVYHKNRQTGEWMDVFTDEMRDAANAFWDAWRDDGDFTDEDWDNFEKAFGGNEELFNKMNALMDALREEHDDNDEWRGIEDLPEEWWRTTGSWAAPNENGVTSQDVQGMNQVLASLPQQVMAGARNGISGLRVDIDGQAAGRILAPYVSREIAMSIQ